MSSELPKSISRRQTPIYREHNPSSQKVVFLFGSVFFVFLNYLLLIFFTACGWTETILKKSLFDGVHKSCNVSLRTHHTRFWAESPHSCVEIFYFYFFFFLVFLIRMRTYNVSGYREAFIWLHFLLSMICFLLCDRCICRSDQWHKSWDTRRVATLLAYIDAVALQ